MKKENTINPENMINPETQEVAEMELLNTRTNERIANETEKLEQEKRKARQAEEEERNACAKAEKAKERRKAYSKKTAASVAALVALSGAVCAAGMAEMIHPAIWITTSITCLCAACVRFGVWFGRVAK